ncbi:hypothetical protein BDR26DRAFT_852536 [Obelidium mucronatum]|nr:hypothetical protein BDR26DRAFT_852536 [Obelidium mucronatum]
MATASTPVAVPSAATDDRQPPAGPVSSRGQPSLSEAAATKLRESLRMSLVISRIRVAHELLCALEDRHMLARQLGLGPSLGATVPAAAAGPPDQGQPQPPPDMSIPQSLGGTPGTPHLASESERAALRSHRNSPGAQLDSVSLRERHTLNSFSVSLSHAQHPYSRPQLPLPLPPQLQPPLDQQKQHLHHLPASPQHSRLDTPSYTSFHGPGIIPHSGYSFRACVRCKKQQKKCTREASGCERCRRLKFLCEYTTPEEDERQRQLKSRAKVAK